MRAVPLAKTLGVGGFAGLQAVGSQLSNALGGFSGSSFSNQAFQHTKTSSSSSTPEAGDGPHETPIPDPFDLEFDRFNGGALADLEASVRPPRQPLDPLSRPVDLEFEMDRDDPEAVDIDQLYESPDEEGDEEEMGMSVKEAVDLDDEYDLMHDHAVGVVEPGSSEQEKLGGSRTGGTDARHSTFEAAKETASRGTPQPPMPPGQGTA
ncbi:hypothetical protein Ndes2526B_g07771 [Nannochloris sp. 'desiccata']|nr:hypothetical protein KSW81_002439 [Chlorella desiccata (nom. nud.)]KAH7617178.1 hypothetical protein NADE_006964 [Chlorella desiccata (nom. nud.)]